MQGLGISLLDFAVVKWAAAGSALAAGVGALRVSIGDMPLAELFACQVVVCLYHLGRHR
jgi:hypothetical protein